MPRRVPGGGWKSLDRDVAPERASTTYIASSVRIVFPLAEARTLADAIPNYRFVVLERSAHQSPLEVPGEVSAAIRDLLQVGSATCLTLIG